MRSKTKILTVYATLLSLALAHAQYGIDGTVAAAGHYAFWEIEKNDMDRIMASQKQIFAVNVTSALEQAKLLDISKERYHSLAHVDDGIENALTIAQIAIEAEKLYDLDRAITDMIAPYPLVQAAVSPALTDLILEQAMLLSDIVIATAEGATNLMGSKDRYAIMVRILSDIKEINALAINIHGEAGTLISLLDIEELVIGETPTYNLTPAVEGTLNVIETLIEEQ